MKFGSDERQDGGDRRQHLEQWARTDAKNDSVVPNWPSFDRRIEQVKNHHTATVITDFMDGFRSRSGALSDKFAEIQGKIEDDPKISVDRKDADVVASIAAADGEIRPRIVACQAEYKEWSDRFKTDLLQGVLNPKKQNTALHWGLLLLLLAIEAILNSRFFAETSEYGLLGGTMAAVTVSVVNVGPPILVAYFTHKLYYSKNAWLKYVGLVLAITLVILAVLFNYEVAEYRDRLLILADKPPSSLPEFYALLVIGFGIAVISFWKVFSFMDPFHRPRRCYLERKSAIDEYKVTALRPIIDAEKEIQSLKIQLDTTIAETHKLVSQEQIDFDYECDHAALDCNADVNYYYLIYHPLQTDPDPDMPEFKVQDFLFSPAKKAIDNTIQNLEKYGETANNEWRSKLAKAEEGLIEVHLKHQAVVIASLPSTT